MVESEPTRIEGRTLDQPTEIELKDISSFDDLSKWTKPIQHGPFLNLKEARQGQMENRFSNLTNKKLIEGLSDKEKKEYIDYLKEVRELILNTPLVDMGLGFATDFGNPSLEKYVKEEKLTLNDLSEKDFVKDTFQTKEQALSRRDTKGARLTSALIDPKKVNELIDPDLLNENIDTEWEDDKIIIRFDSLKYMKALFDRYNYDEPFEFETDDKFDFTGQLAIEKDGELLNIPDSRLIVVGGEDVPIDLVGSYIEGEGLSTNTVITRPKNKGKVEIDGKVVQEYEYITVSPPKKDKESTEKNQYKLTVVHSNVNSIVGVTDNTSRKTAKASSELKNYIYWLEMIDTSGSYTFMEDQEIYAIYAADRSKPLVDFTTAEKMTENIGSMFTGSYVSTKDDRQPYEFKSMDEPIGAIIANSLKPSQKEKTTQKIQVFDTVIPLGTVEIILKTNVYDQMKALGGKKGREKSKPENPQLMSLITDYKKYQDIIEAFDKAIKQSDQAPFNEFSRMVPNATAEDFNDLLDIYEGSDSRGYRKGRDVYRAFLFMADKDLKADELKDAARKGTNNEVLTSALAVLEGLAGEKKEKTTEYSSSTFLSEFGDVKLQLEKKTPLVSVEAVDYRYRKQINLSGPMRIAGKEREGEKTPTYDIKGSSAKLKQLVKGIRQFNRRIEALDD
jgi:hypothetical protein